MGVAVLASVGIGRGIARLVGDGEGTSVAAVGNAVPVGEEVGSVAEVLSPGVAVAAVEGTAVTAAGGDVTVDIASVPEVVASGSSSGLRHPTTKMAKAIASRVKK